jgi:hypothetical protein
MVKKRKKENSRNRKKYSMVELCNSCSRIDDSVGEGGQEGDEAREEGRNKGIKA